MEEINGSFNGKNKKVSIVIGRFNEFITKSLLSGAIDCLKRHQVSESDIRIIYVPGAMEIPLAIKYLAKQKKDDALIALGAVIKGSTAHFDYVSSFSSNGVANIGLDYDIPVMNGILTVNSIEQAIERAGTKAGNKGFECALGALEMINVLEQIK